MGSRYPAFPPGISTEFESYLEWVRSAIEDFPAFGEISVEGSAVETVVTVISTWYQVTVFDTNGHSKLTTPDHTNDHILIHKQGLYRVVVSATLETVGAGARTIEVELKVNNNGTAFTNVHAHRDMAGGGGEKGSVSLSGIVEFAAGDTVEIWIENTTGTENVTIADATLSIVQVERGA